MIWASMLPVAVVSFQVRALLSGFIQCSHSLVVFLGLLIRFCCQRRSIDWHSLSCYSFQVPVNPSHQHVEFFGLKDVLGQSASRVPILLFCIYQLMFAAITFIHYFPNQYWTWNVNGWSAKLGGHSSTVVRMVRIQRWFRHLRQPSCSSGLHRH